MNTFGNDLISPFKDMKYKENTFTPLKNEIIAYNFFSPAMRVESPFESKNNILKII